jgi:hypothetical protein
LERTANFNRYCPAGHGATAGRFPAVSGAKGMSGRGLFTHRTCINSRAFPETARVRVSSLARRADWLGPRALGRGDRPCPLRRTLAVYRQSKASSNPSKQGLQQGFQQPSEQAFEQPYEQPYAPLTMGDFPSETEAAAIHRARPSKASSIPTRKPSSKPLSIQEQE